MIVTNYINCASAVKGTGTKGCLTNMNEIMQFALLEWGTKLNTATDILNNDKIKELITTGKLVILPKHDILENQSAETVYQDLSGVKKFVRNGLYEFLLQFDAGLCFSNAINTLRNKKWQVVVIDTDSENNYRIWFEETVDGYLKGFDASLVSAENKKLNDGSVSTTTPLRIQLSKSGTAAFNSNASFVAENENLSLSNLDGVNDVNIGLISLTPAVISVKIACDNSTDITGLTTADFYFTDATGQVPSPNITVAWDSTLNGYILSNVVASTTLNIRLRDTVNNTNIVEVDGDYYQSDTLSASF